MGRFSRMRRGANLGRTGLALTAIWLGVSSCSTPTADDPEPADTAPCQSAVPLCASTFAVASEREVPIYRTHDPTRPDTSIATLLVMIHGTNRDHDRYFETAVAAARDAGVLRSTLVIAPQFRTADDQPESGAPYWTSGGWKRGHLSPAASGSPRISSYEVLEGLLASVTSSSDRFPNLESIVVAGHSAGGQVVHRFAAATALHGVPDHLDVRFVVANPSTYLYLGPERWDGSGYSVPVAGGCPDYQRWHYGLEELNSYMRDRSADDVRTRLTDRDVRVLLGTADTLDAQLDVSCGAMLQGENRLDRGRRLVAYMTGTRPDHGHRIIEIQGVGHSSRSMFTSDAGLVALFR